jgi:hypothetical protein
MRAIATEDVVVSADDLAAIVVPEFTNRPNQKD